MPIVAHEYGIPAVLDTQTAAARPRDDMQVLVDGSRGMVLIQESSWLPASAVLSRRRLLRQAYHSCLLKIAAAPKAVCPAILLLLTEFNYF